VRDRRGAQEDLQGHGLAFKRRQLAALMGGGDASPPFGMLLFSCNGRGSFLYGEPDWDSRAISEYVPVPVAGCLCNGEIGKVAGSSRLHGFTCAVGVLRVAPAPAGDAGDAAAAEAGQGTEGAAEREQEP
jgi:small ligand-binding sensory domain FIST